jgi:hypothetical protein
VESIPEQVRLQVLRSQRSEITEHHIYSRLAAVSGDRENSKVLQDIADDELRHYRFWREHTGRDMRRNRFRSTFFFWISRLFGLTFGIKLMERGEEQAGVDYREIARYVPGALDVAEDEDTHEKKLIELISEERLNYVGSTCSGSTKPRWSSPVRWPASRWPSVIPGRPGGCSGHGGVHYLCLQLRPVRYDLSVAKDFSFKRGFIEMACLSLGVALISFGIGHLIRVVPAVEV